MVEQSKFPNRNKVEKGDGDDDTQAEVDYEARNRLLQRWRDIVDDIRRALEDIGEMWTFIMNMICVYERRRQALD